MGDRIDLEELAISGAVANTKTGSNFATSTSAFGDIHTCAGDFVCWRRTIGSASRSSVAASSSWATRVSGSLELTLKITAIVGGETTCNWASSNSNRIALFISFHDSVSAEMIERGSSACN